jgi:hypothetical protein
VPTLTEPPAQPVGPPGGRRARNASLAGLVLILAGCGEPSLRELENRRELEALLTAISLQNQRELERDVKRIDDRHTSGQLSDEGYSYLQDIIKKAQAGDWTGAEKQAYALRQSKPFFH